MTKTKVLNQIAKKSLNISTLVTRRSDSLDYHELAVWQIKAALSQAYDAGRNESCGYK